MKLTLMEDEIVDMLIEDYDVDEMDAHDAVIAAKVLELIKVDESVDTNAERIYTHKQCWDSN